MTKEHSDHPKKTRKQNEGDMEDEKFFDFNKTFGEDSEVPNLSEDNSDEKMASLEASLAEYKEKNLRLLAEFDNYKKRTMRERLELLNSASR